MKAVPMNEAQGGYQSLSGFDRQGADWSGADGYFADAYLGKLLKSYKSAIRQKLAGSGDSAGGNGGSTESTNACSSLYGLYSTMDGAAFAWSRLFGRYGMGKYEYSGLIYKIRGKELYGFTRAVRFPDKRKGTNDPDPTMKSPDPFSSLHNETLPPDVEIVGHIHIHLLSATNPLNRDFSPDDAWNTRDQGMIRDHGEYNYYLVNNEGNLRVHRNGERNANTPYTEKIAYNFYGRENNDYRERDPLTGRVTNYGNVGYPDIDVINYGIRSIQDTYPQLYINFCGKLYGLDRVPLKKPY